jgi:uncharacterized protein
MRPEQQATTAPVFTVRVDGADLAPEVRAEVTRVSVEQSVDAAGTFAIELSNWDPGTSEVRWSDDDRLQPGGAVEIRLGHADAEVLPVMAGEITGLELAFPEGAPATMTVRGYDRLHRFRRGRRTRAYLQAKDSGVAVQIAGDLGLGHDVEDSGEVHPVLVQANQTDIDFLLTRARAIGYELLVDDRTLRFRKLDGGRATSTSLSFAHGLVAFSAYLSTADQVSEVNVRGWDPQAKQALVGRARAGDLTAVMGGRQSGPAAADSLFGTRTLSLVEQPVRTQNEADLLARGLLDARALGYVTAEATLIGNPAIGAGTVVELSGLGTRFNGPYYAARVAHVWDGRFLTHLRLRRNAA